MMHIHTLMCTTADFTFIIRSQFNKFLNLLPFISICNGRISSHPVWVIFAMQSIYCPPVIRTLLTTKMMFNGGIEITSRSLKFITTIGTFFDNSVSWPSPSFWSYIIAFTGAIFSFITNKIKKLVTANNTGKSLLSYMIFNSHNTKIMFLCEIDKDYYDAAVKRFNIYKMQTKLF